MARIKITISQPLDTLPRRLKQGLAIGQNGAGLHAQTHIKQSIRAVNAVASKELVDTIEAPKVELLGANSIVVKVGSKKKQAFWIEYGRKAEAFLSWAAAKVILRAWAAAKGLQITDSGLWFIRKKIIAEGFKAREPFKKARAAMAPGIARIIKAEIGKVIQGR